MKTILRKLNTSIVFIFLFFIISCGPSAEELATKAKAVSDSIAAKDSVAADIVMPTLWPIPIPSSKTDIPTNMLTIHGKSISLSGVNDKLCAALSANGYDDKSYFKVPGGFALVTHIEQINSDGTSKKTPNRWSLQFKPFDTFNLNNYLKALLHAPIGYFRVIIFVVNSQPIVPKGAITEDSAIVMMNTGADRLPSSFEKKLFTINHACTACIYEFKHTQALTKVDFIKSGSLSAETHLRKAGIWASLKN